MALPEAPVIGRLSADPELRYTQDGVAVANFSIGVNDRILDRSTNEWKDGPTSWFRVTVWRELAEHAAASLTKGQEVIVVGKIAQKEYETKDGEKRTSIEVTASSIGPSLRFGTATFTRTPKGGQGDAPAEAAAPQAAAPAAPAAPQADAPAYVDDTPF